MFTFVLTLCLYVIFPRYFSLKYSALHKLWIYLWFHWPNLMPLWHIWSEKNWCTENKKSNDKDRKKEWIKWKWDEGYHPPEQTAHPVSLSRKSAQTQKIQKPSGLGGYATSRDKRGSFTEFGPARAICSWWEWVGDGTPGTSRTPIVLKHDRMAIWFEHNMKPEVWKYEFWWVALRNGQISMRIMTDKSMQGCTMLLHREWQHVLSFAQQW